MDLGRPIADIVPSLDGPVLQALARTTRPLTGRDVHRLAGVGSEAGVRKVLDRLARHGLVHVARAGPALLYVANRDHIAWAAVEVLARLRETLLERLRAEFQTWRHKPVTAALFGSAARGDGTVTSDIDMFLVRAQGLHNEPIDRGEWQDQLERLREQVTVWTGNHCQIYELDEEEFAVHVHTGERIVDEWKRDAILLYGEPLNQLVVAATRRGSR